MQKGPRVKYTATLLYNPDCLETISGMTVRPFAFNHYFTIVWHSQTFFSGIQCNSGLNSYSHNLPTCYIEILDSDETWQKVQLVLTVIALFWSVARTACRSEVVMAERISKVMNWTWSQTPLSPVEEQMAAPQCTRLGDAATRRSKLSVKTHTNTDTLSALYAQICQLTYSTNTHKLRYTGTLVCRALVKCRSFIWCFWPYFVIPEWNYPHLQTHQMF